MVYSITWKTGNNNDIGKIINMGLIFSQNQHYFDEKNINDLSSEDFSL